MFWTGATALCLMLALLLLAGCGDPLEMSTEEVAAKLEECKKYGLHADVYRAFGDGVVMKIQCVPDKE